MSVWLTRDCDSNQRAIGHPPPPLFLGGNSHLKAEVKSCKMFGVKYLNILREVGIPTNSQLSGLKSHLFPADSGIGTGCVLVRGEQRIAKETKSGRLGSVSANLSS